MYDPYVLQWGKVTFTMEVSLGNIGVAVSVLTAMIGGLWKMQHYLDQKLSWLDEMYYFWCKENGRRVPDALAKKFVKANGDTKDSLR